MNEEEQVALVNHGDCYHKAVYHDCMGVGILHTGCGLSSLVHDITLHPRDKLSYYAPSAKPCQKCFKEGYCELCGEKMPGLQFIMVESKPRLACELCVEDFG